MHVDFDPMLVDWSTFGPDSPPTEFAVQFGGYSMFRGVPYQRGSGFGSVFRRFWRFLLPIGKEIGSAVARQGLESGNRVLGNVLEGKDLKESLVEEGKTGLKNLLNKAASNLEKQKGQGFDFKRYKKSVEEPRIGKHINKLSSTIGPPSFLPKLNRKNTTRKTKRKVKKVRIDALGTY